MIGAVILAAGEARRMGEAKQLLDWQDKPLIRHMVQMVLKSEFDLIRVIIGAYAHEVRQALEDLPVEIIINPLYAEGQSTSVKKGLEGLSKEVSGIAFILADQPLTKPETYNQLIEYFLQVEPGILIPTYQGQRGNPIIFHQDFFSQLMQVVGDRGGREIIRQNPDRVMLLEVDDPGILIDLDEKKDYLHYMQIVKSKIVKSNEVGDIKNENPGC